MNSSFAKHFFVLIESQKFEGDSMSLDNQHFSNCEFEACEFLYSGGPLIMNGCRLHNCKWTLQGSAAMVVESLTTCGWHIVPHDHAASIKTVC